MVALGKLFALIISMALGLFALGMIGLAVFLILGGIHALFGWVGVIIVVFVLLCLARAFFAG